jgi:hypothetical protein
MSADSGPDVTVDTITDAQIRELMDALPPTHDATQWCRDALGSRHHPMRRWNARRECAAMYIMHAKLRDQGKRAP